MMQSKWIVDSSLETNNQEIRTKNWGDLRIVGDFGDNDKQVNS